MHATFNPLIVKMPPDEKETYILDKRLGKGSQGNVCKAYRVVSYTIDGKPVPSEVAVALKVIDCDDDDLIWKQAKLEGEITQVMNPLARVYSRYPIIFIATTFVEGVNLEQYLAANQLTLLQGIRLIKKVAVVIDEIHTKRVIHADILPVNLMVKIGDEKEVEIHPIDFGRSCRTKNNSNQLMRHPCQYSGHINYPPESLSEKFGFKSDIYMAVYVFSKILGVKDPCVDKRRAGNEVPYNLDGIIKFDDIPQWPMDYRKLTLQFLNRMQNNDYDSRPDAREVVTFFSTLEKLYELSQVKSESDRKDNKDQNSNHFKVYTTKLFLMATGRWHEKVTDVIQLKLNPNGTMNQLDLEKYPEALGIIHDFCVAEDDMQNKIWSTPCRILMRMETETAKISDKKMLATINTNRPTIVTACVAELRLFTPEARHKMLMDIKLKKNALGAIINVPRDPIRFAFSGRENTTTVDNILKAFQPAPAQNQDQGQSRSLS